jgi:ADP-heptose:LPS heptosyltransferase
VLTGSAADALRIEAILTASHSRAPRSTLHAPTLPINLAGKTDLAQLAELYRRCALLITNDSGPMHIAAAVGTPVVAIFGPTDPALTGPYGKQHVVLRAGIPCSPCLKPYCTHTPRMECMSLVSVEQVLEAVKGYI